MKLLTMAHLPIDTGIQHLTKSPLWSEHKTNEIANSCTPPNRHLDSTPVPSGVS